MGRPREHDEKTAAGLVTAAERIIEQEGVEALSVRRVADDVGTTTRAVYSLFGSKEGLLVAVGVHAFELLAAKVNGQRLGKDPAHNLAIAGLAFREFALEHPALFRVGIQRMLPDPELAHDFAASAGETFAVLERRVEALAVAGGLPRRGIREAAVQYHALCEGLAAVELRGGMIERGAGEKVWRDALAALVAGLREPAPRRQPASRAKRSGS